MDIIDGICKEYFIKYKVEGLGSKASLAKDIDLFFITRGRLLHRIGLREMRVNIL